MSVNVVDDRIAGLEQEKNKEDKERPRVEIHELHGMKEGRTTSNALGGREGLNNRDGIKEAGTPNDDLATQINGESPRTEKLGMTGWFSSES